MTGWCPACARKAPTSSQACTGQQGK